MNARRGMAFGSLAVLGLALAIALGLLANAIAGDSIGLSAKPLRAGDQLAPAAAGRSTSGEGGQHGSGRDRRPSRGRDQASPTPSATTTATTPTITAEPGDDHGGAGVDNSGPGSLNSGSGSSGSGSSGSGSSGSGSSGSSGSGSSGDD